MKVEPGLLDMNMKQIATFYKVSEEQFNLDNNNNNDKSIYDDIKLPKRATVGSAGYDFFLPFDINLKPNETIKIPTGIRVKMDEGYVLLIFPRSSLGFKYQLKLANTIGVIDQDYFNALNEGHIQIKLVNGDKELALKKGDAFVQGIFLPFGITLDDDASAIRLNGFGSTNK